MIVPATPDRRRWLTGTGLEVTWRQQRDRNTHKSDLDLGGVISCRDLPLFISSTGYENMPLPLLVMQRSCNGGRSPISDFHHLCGDAIRPELTTGPPPTHFTLSPSPPRRGLPTSPLKPKPESYGKTPPACTRAPKHPPFPATPLNPAPQAPRRSPPPLLRPVKSARIMCAVTRPSLWFRAPTAGVHSRLKRL